MKALLIVDVQYDFCPGGALPVPNGDTIIPTINALIPHFDCIVQTQDWHPKNHSSFASNYEGKSPYDTIKLNYGEQVLWPDHCVQSTHGADFHRILNKIAPHMIVRKGFRADIDSYSAFFENDHETATGLDGYLKERGVEELFITGLATDFCVKWSALDAAKLGYKTTVVSDAVEGIDMDGSVGKAIKEMKEAGIHFTNSKEILNK
ncbi:MAG: bifunctional nicotinamidase/pyrazinamidase [Balneolaceae bacterium]|nr:bifunctional nicotinamidase/pyrazinamidase [Balneolaceae bacterium]